MEKDVRRVCGKRASFQANLENVTNERCWSAAGPSARGVGLGRTVELTSTPDCQAPRSHGSQTVNNQLTEINWPRAKGGEPRSQRGKSSSRGVFLKWSWRNHGRIDLRGAVVGLLFGEMGSLPNHRAVLKIRVGYASAASKNSCECPIRIPWLRARR
ncbi:hypothetical protein CJU94_23770 [Paraburkholderia aromaticivorans]|uniref:Uncharacterized protein n=1 Tax=Paraburkholderia aromaticivorans TaxID=2026199 RepID=A0A248VQB9_9BURK|nr:hypothetical protein CJU94_23770 [Paraburkholderia aromaticivorans]